MVTNVSLWILQGRRRAKLTQRGLAKSLGVSAGAVAQWESGERRPALARLIDMAAVFGVPIDGLVGPDASYAGALVEAPDELALLGAFRRLTDADRGAMLRLLTGGWCAGPVQHHMA